MTVRQWGLGFFLIFTFAILFSIFKKDLSEHKDSSTHSTQTNKKSLLKSRDLILGHPQFIQNEKKDFSMLKKHIKDQWALKDISLLKAWEIVESKTIKPPLIVAVVDTGIHKKHSCLKNSLWINPGEKPNNGKDDDGNGFIDDIHGWNFVNNNNDIQDYHGHGTHVSGIIAALGTTPQSPNCKIIGVAPHVRIMTLKYFDEGAESSDNIKNTIKAIKYAVDNGADIINYSGGGPGDNPEEKAAIAKAGDKNIIFVAALGNEGSKIGQKIKYYPASYKLPNILFVQSQNKQNEIIKSSNRIQHEYLAEDKKEQTAPGEDILSTLPPKLYLQGLLKSKIFRSLAASRIQHDHYGYMTGTSQATAVATGVVALVKTTYPSWSLEKWINQVEKTGFGQGTEKIKKETNQGKKLSAYKALIMRDKNVDLSDQIDNTNTAVPHSDDPRQVDTTLKHPRPPKQLKPNQYEYMQEIDKTIKQKSK